VLKLSLSKGNKKKKKKSGLTKESKITNFLSNEWWQEKDSFCSLDNSPGLGLRFKFRV
jgi:hypothetical protein